MDNILTQPNFFIGFIVLLGYMLLRKPFYESIAGFLKATVGYMILQVGSGGLVNNFRPILVGLKDRFNLTRKRPFISSYTLKVLFLN